MRDQQQRMLAGPRPSPTPTCTGSASPSRSNETFVTASSTKRNTETAGQDTFWRLGGLSSSSTIYDDPEPIHTADADGSGQDLFPSIPQTRSPELFTASEPTIAKPSRKHTALRLDTLKPLAPATSPKEPVSPSLQHWQQVRDHVMTPAEERATHSLARSVGNEKEKKKFGLVSKAAGKFGIKQAADHIIKGDEKRKNTMAMTAEYGALTSEQREEITRERRRFARDIKACLDACSAEETRRRLMRLGKGKGKEDTKPPGGNNGGIHQGSLSHRASAHTPQHVPQRPAYDNDFYAFAPLLTELHRHMPAARAKKPWSRTCPHQAPILAELATAFLDDDISTDGERQQALEVFGTVVRNWAADSPEEELSRWTWLCQAMLWDDHQLRDRGLGLLETILRPAPITDGTKRHYSAHAFETLATSLLRLLHAVETSHNRQDRHIDAVDRLLTSMGDGDIIELRLSTVAELVDTQDDLGSLGVIRREMIWTAVGSSSSSSPEVMDWLFKDRAANALRFSPPPILHGTPLIIRQLRARSLSLFLRCFMSLVDRCERPLDTIWEAAIQVFEADLELLESAALFLAWARFLIAMEMAANGPDHEGEPQEQTEDPFRISTVAVRPVKKNDKYLERVARCWGNGAGWQNALKEAARQQIASGPLRSVLGMVRALLRLECLALLAHTGVGLLMERLASMSPPPLEARPLFRYLQSNHPQLLYKPLFACAAAASTPSLISSLRTLNATTAIIGTWTFWVQSDPQMIAIVLMGGAGLRSNKCKTIESEAARLTVKIGRYAAMVELLRALEKVDASTQADEQVKGFMYQLEAKLGVMIESEEKDGRYPDDYRALLCLLLYRLRLNTGSLKRAHWRHTIVQWILEASMETLEPPLAIESTSESALQILRNIYFSFEAEAKGTGHAAQVPPKTKRTTVQYPPKRQNTMLSSGSYDTALNVNLIDAATSLLVLVQSTLTTEDWTLLLEPIWMGLEDDVATGSKAFLMTKCAEKCPTAMQELVMLGMTQEDPSMRTAAIRRIAKLHGWRYQILARKTLTNRRGPTFHFPLQNLGYVATEIGLPHHVQPQEVQDAALQKFGNTLPLELRQRLMELGWTENDHMVNKRDFEYLPLSALPPLQLLNEDDLHGTSSSPGRLGRSLSNGSGHSATVKRRKPLFAPNMISLVDAQALELFVDGDAIAMTTSRELVKLFQRDDANGFFRSIGEGFQDNLVKSLVRLRSVASTVTPGFAYAAVNAMVGYARPAVRLDPAFPAYVEILTTIAIIMKGLSGVSLRDIRKNRSENVLLPASIHEDEGGYKLHAPWQDGQVEAQTAQLLILHEILRSNPKDVYLIKKMLSNLQIQSSISSLTFSRAWLLLIAHLFGTVNRTYTDRAELRHFLTNVGAILRAHGHRDLPIVAQSMRIFMLCSARFRRVYASVGFQSTMSATFDTYVRGNDATKDCIEYAMRSFHRIHGDTFVHLGCVTISEGDIDARDLYRLLASLSSKNTPSSGVASGIQDLNKKEEIDALVHMVNGPELAFSEIGTAATERRAAKISSVNFEETVFPKPNIVKLFATVVAASPASARARRFLLLLAGMIPGINDDASLRLLRESVEALGRIMARGRVIEDARSRVAADDTENGPADWNGARVAYIAFVDAYAREGGQLSSGAIKRTLELVPELLRKNAEMIGPAVASFIGSMAKTYLTSTRPAIFLRDIAPLFRTFMSVVDFSGLLDQISHLIRDTSFDLDTETTAVIIEHYVGPSIQALESASKDNLAFVLPLRTSTVNLLSVAVFLRGDPWAAVEASTPSASLLASVILPLTLRLETPEKVDRDAVFTNLWIRILHFVLSRSKTAEAAKVDNQSITMAAREVLVFQIVKIICIRAPDTISTVRGLWVYIADRLTQMTAHPNDKFLASFSSSSPSMVDWMLWSLYELLALHRSPLMLSFRPKIHYALSQLRNHNASRPASPLDRSRGSSLSPTEAAFRSRQSNIWTTHKRVPSFQHQSNIRAGEHESRPSLSPGQIPDHVVQSHSHSRLPSHSLRRSPNSERSDPFNDAAQPKRPSFVDISARRGSRPSFDAFQARGGMNNRFPSSATVRQLPRQNGGAPIVHLLGAPNQVSAAISGGLRSPSYQAVTPDARSAASEITIHTEELVKGTRRAVRAVQIVFGCDADSGDDDEPIRTWSVQDALHVIADQTKHFVEGEFGSLLNPLRSDMDASTKDFDLPPDEDSFFTEFGLSTKINDDDGDDYDDDNEHSVNRVPVLNVTPA